LFGGGFRKVEEQAKHYPPEAQQTIIVNLGAYVNAVNSEVQQQVAAGSFDTARAESLLNTPTVQRLLSTAAECASENDDALSMRSLASLVVAALQAESGTRLSQIVRLSERALKDLRAANLRQLAIIFTWKQYGPSPEAVRQPTPEEQLDLIEMELFPLFEAMGSVKIPYLDALVLEEARTVAFRQSVSGHNNPRFESRNQEMHAALYSPGAPVGDRAAIKWFLSGLQPGYPGGEHFGAPNFALTASGYALGYIALKKAIHEDVKLDELFGDD
jgi:hypothetical protein